MSNKDLHSEKALLACVCQYGLDAYADIDYITNECFTDQSNALIFDILKDIVERGAKPDIPLILSTANDKGFGSFFERPEELGFIRSLFNLPITLSNVGQYAIKLKKKYILDKLKQINLAVNKDLSKLTGQESIQEMLEVVEKPLAEILNSVYGIEEDEPSKIFEDMENYIYELMENNSKYSGLKTGFDHYDQAIGGGLRRKGVDVIAGRPKSAKSTMGLQIGLNLASRGVPVLIVDTEMNIDGIRNRSIANQSGVDVNEITSAEIKKKQAKFKQVIKTAQEKYDLPIYHKNVAGRDFKSILAIMKKWLMKHVGRDETGKIRDCLIIYDYLKLTTSDDISMDMQEYQVLGFQMTELYNFMVKNDCACLAYVQLNRGMDVSQSDRIKWLCTSFTKFLLKSDEEMAEDIANGINPPYNRKLEVECCRWGPGTEFGNYINVRVRGQFATIDAGPTRDEANRKTNIDPPDISACGTSTDPSGSDGG